jgi:hypothetical protein
MKPKKEKTFRPWVVWLIGCIWAGTALAVLIAIKLHPSTIANIEVHTRKVSLRTNASHILGPSNQEQLLISGLNSVQIRFNKEQNIEIGGRTRQVSSLDAEGDSLSSCSFYRVRSTGFEVRGPAVITFEVLNLSNEKAFSMKAHGGLNDNLSSLPNERGLPSAFECRGLRVHGELAAAMEGSFSPEGGDTLFVATAPDSRLDFTTESHADVGDTQIPILGEVRFSEIDPGTSEEKSVLLKPPPVITFEKTEKKVSVDAGDLLVVVPEKGFYLRQFTVSDGIQLSLHGRVRDIRSGAGARDLATLMPSAFDQADHATRIFGAIGALAAFVFGILEKMGLLGNK